MNLNAITARIDQLRKQRNAVILAHYYQRPEVQDVADFVGDSLDLSRKAAATTADVIVFCGVHFMAETAKILAPSKTVLIPDENAACPMANMLTVRELRQFKAQYPDAITVAYVNCSAAVKAEVDICCTSANAPKVVASLPKNRPILFVPDQSLGDFINRKFGFSMILWPGFCPTHHRFLQRDINDMRAAHPHALLCVHPECTRDVIDQADFVGSTSQIINFCSSSPASEFIIGTEQGILHPLKKRNPSKNFYHLSPLATCSNMKLTTLEKIIWSLEDMIYEISIPEDIRQRAFNAVHRMIQIV
ncbi:MAG: quinolinate synthase NadA [bacterium]|nr:quinolinate synthase NadA [bacterium]